MRGKSLLSSCLFFILVKISSAAFEFATPLKEQSDKNHRMKDMADIMSRQLGLGSSPINNMPDLDMEALRVAFRTYEKSLKLAEKTEALEEIFQEADEGEIKEFTRILHPSRVIGRTVSGGDDDSDNSISLHFEDADVASLGNLTSASTAAAAVKVDRASLRVRIAMDDLSREINDNDIHLKVIQMVDRSGGEDGGIIVDRISASGGSTTVRLDVTSALQSWILNPDEANLGLKVACKKCYFLNEAELTAELKVLAESSGRRKRSVENLILKKVRKISKKAPKSKECSERRPGKGKKKKSPRCCRDSMEVDFDQLQGFDHIVQPRKFDAYVCRGRCPYRMVSMANSHTWLQSLVSKMNKKVPKPCCAPARFTYLPVIHRDPEDPKKPRVSHFKDAIVTACKCS